MDNVVEVTKELNELSKLGVSVPKAKMDPERIKKFFGDDEYGSRELSEMIDCYLMI
jgi:hypothetical protein